MAKEEDQVPEVSSVVLSKPQAALIVQMCEGAWKMGAIRSPEDGVIVEGLKSMILKAFKVPESKEKKVEVKK